MINFIKRIIILLCVLYSVGRIYFLIWTKSLKIVSIIQAANLEPLDVSIVSWSIYVILAIIAVVFFVLIIWLFTEKKHEE